MFVLKPRLQGTIAPSDIIKKYTIGDWTNGWDRMSNFLHNNTKCKRSEKKGGLALNGKKVNQLFSFFFFYNSKHNSKTSLEVQILVGKRLKNSRLLLKNSYNELKKIGQQNITHPLPF